MTKTIDLRSDTVTQPTRAMREAMLTCEVGDDVLGEDPTINRLEARAAALLGKEAALFVPSGTFGNQCALATHINAGDEVLLSEGAHIVVHECGAAAYLAGAQLRCIPPSNGSRLTVADLQPRLRVGDDIHIPRTGLICVEQATAFGELYGLADLQAIYAFAGAAGVPVHLDGARLFNAALALDVSPAALAACADSVTFCLSKGLCAPVGSLLVGTRAFIAKARRRRKLMGGGLRQAGFLAAAGLVALDTQVARLADDHRHARLLADLLTRIPGVTLSREPAINMVFVRTASPQDPAQTLAALTAQGVLTYAPENGEWRFVTHQGIEETDVRLAAQVLARCWGPQS
jgi:threonine aldolase